MKIRLAALLLFSVSVFVTADLKAQDDGLKQTEVAFLCADQADRNVKLLAPAEDGKEVQVLWRYPASGEMFQYAPTDAKRVEIEGVTHILVAYHGRVQLLRFEDQALLKDYPTYGSCHSAEVLPDGAIVTANSNHGKLRLHLSSEEFKDYELPYAHGLCWDAKRECLWGLGDQLYRYDYREGELTLTKAFPLPLDPTGHDLFPMATEEKLLVTDNVALYVFDIATEEFEVLSKIRSIKSVSEAADGSLWITEPKQMEGARPWHTDSIIDLDQADGVRRHSFPGSRFYKARWWQQVGFSYPLKGEH